MSQGAYVTLVGFVAQDPTIRATATGKQLTRVRVGTTPRYRDDEAGQWRDGETSYFDVKCWNRLAAHVRAKPAQGRAGHRQGKVQDQHVQGQGRPDEDLVRDHGGHPGT